MNSIYLEFLFGFLVSVAVIFGAVVEMFRSFLLELQGEDTLGHMIGPLPGRLDIGEEVFDNVVTVAVASDKLLALFFKVD